MSNDIVEQTLTQQIVTLTLQGIPAYKQAEELKVSRYRVEKIQKSADFKALLKELSDKAVEVAVSAFRAKMDELEPLAFEALKANLKDKKLEAVRIWAEMTGLRDRKDGEQKDTTLTVILPGAPVPEKAVDSTVIEIGGKDDN